MSNNRFWISALSILGLAAAGPALAQDGLPPPPMDGGGPRMHGPLGMMGMLGGVQLTADQKAKLHAMHNADKAAMRARFAQIRQVDDQIRGLLMADGPVDRAKLGALFQQKDALLAQSEQAHVDDAIKVHDLLTPQQLAAARDTHMKMKSLQEQMWALMKPAAQME